MTAGATLEGQRSHRGRCSPTPTTTRDRLLLLDGVCADWCALDAVEPAPGRGGRPRDGMPVDEMHRAQCRGGCDIYLRGVDCDGYFRTVEVTTASAYLHGDYPAGLPGTVDRGARVVLSMEGDELQDGRSLDLDGRPEVFITPPEARSLAAALIAVADRLERPGGPR